MSTRSTSEPSNTTERALMSTHYDVVVLGTGPGGYVAAIEK